MQVPRACIACQLALYGLRVTDGDDRSEGFSGESCGVRIQLIISLEITSYADPSFKLDDKSVFVQFVPEDPGKR